MNDPLPTLEDASAALQKSTRTLHRLLRDAGIAERVRGGRLTTAAACHLGLVTHDTNSPAAVTSDDTQQGSALVLMTPDDTELTPRERFDLATSEAMQEPLVPTALLSPVMPVTLPDRDTRKPAGEWRRAVALAYSSVSGAISIAARLACSMLGLLLYAALWIVLPTPVIDWLFAKPQSSRQYTSERARPYSLRRQ